MKKKSQKLKRSLQKGAKTNELQVHQLYQEENEAREVWNMEELRKHAKEITKQCEEKGYTIEETEMLVHVLQNEIDQCKKIILQKNFKALAE